MQIRLGIFCSFFLLGGLVMAQSTRDVDAPEPPRPMYQAQKKGAKKKTLFFFRKKEQDGATAFENRMKAVSRQRKKDARLAEKPQYSNPLYFGHKKPPKKRPLHKRKLCKECLVVH